MSRGHFWNMINSNYDPFGASTELSRMSKLRVILNGVECMRRKKRPIWLLVVSLLSLASLIYLILNFPPNWKFEIGNYLKFDILYIFFTLLFTFFFPLIAFLLNNKRRGLFFGLFVLTILVLRLNYLLHPFFLILLLAFFITLELLFKRRK